MNLLQSVINFIIMNIYSISTYFFQIFQIINLTSILLHWILKESHIAISDKYHGFSNSVVISLLALQNSINWTKFIITPYFHVRCTLVISAHTYIYIDGSYRAPSNVIVYYFDPAKRNSVCDRLWMFYISFVNNVSSRKICEKIINLLWSVGYIE